MARDDRAFPTALAVLEERNKQMSQESDPGAGGPSDAQFSG